MTGGKWKPTYGKPRKSQRSRKGEAGSQRGTSKSRLHFPELSKFPLPLLCKSYFHLPPSTWRSSPEPQASTSPSPRAESLGSILCISRLLLITNITISDLPCLWALFYWLIWLIPKVLQRVSIKGVTLNKKGTAWVTAPRPEVGTWWIPRGSAFRHLFLKLYWEARPNWRLSKWSQNHTSPD